MQKKDLRPDIIQRLIRDYHFKEENGYLRYGVCPECSKKELFTSTESPWVIKCGRENNCGTRLHVKSLYADLFNSWSDRYESTPENPTAAADAYLQEGRGLDTKLMKGWYTQEIWYKNDAGSATVRFSLDSGVWWERIIDRPERFDRKANFHGSYAGLWWAPPGLDLSNVKQIWITEGIFDAISLYQNGVAAVSVMTAGNYPDKALKALAERYAHKPLPRLVWALDNGKAGESAILRHVRRSRDQGWQSSAALPSSGESAADWNDLHLTGKLTERHRKTYRYYGDLLLVDNARDKALRMFEYMERPEFHFVFNHCVYWFKLDIERHMKAVERIINDRNIRDEHEARRIALNEAGAIKEIANCEPVPLYYMRSQATDEAWYYFRISFPDGAGIVKDAFTAAQLASSSEFKKRLLQVAKGGLYTGSGAQLDALIKKGLPKIKEVMAQDFIGYNIEWGGWVFNDIAVFNGNTYSLNSEDYFEVGKMNIKTISRKPVLKINTRHDELTTQWLDDIWTAFGEKGYVALAFWLGSFFAEQLRQTMESYPFLEVVGEPGTGKSTLIDFLWRLCGRDGYEGFDPSKSSQSGRMRNFAQVANLPVVLVEGDRGGDKHKRGAFDFDELKDLYGGGGVGARGVATNDNATNERCFRGAVVIAQNAVVNASPAILERIIHIFTDKSRQSAQTRKAAERLEKLPVESVSGFMHRAISREAQILQVVDEVYATENDRLYGHPDIRHTRIAKNHAQMIALIRALPCVLEVPEGRIEATCGALENMAIERVRAVSVDLPVVREFWDTFDYLNSRDPFGVNHAGRDNKSEIAISFPHLMRIAAVERIDMPPAKEIQEFLKSGRMRPYVDQKTVVSKVSELANRGRGEAAQKEPERLKCWIFRYGSAE